MLESAQTIMPVGDTSLAAAEILRDYRLACQSRQASLIGRREVMSGKAKFGIFGDGKELPQLAMARAFRKGDWRSGYYRDQTFMFALGLLTYQEFFAQLYAHADVHFEPASGGRAMNAHFATRILNPDGSWKNQTELYNSAADISPTGSQMPRLVGLAYASRLYRELPELAAFTQFSRHGDEVAFGTIGNASCAEGMFWEAVNAVGVLHAPMVLSIWDDGFGISVPSEYQVAKTDLWALLCGFQRHPGSIDGLDVHSVKGWDYPALVKTYAKAAETARRTHVASIIHVTELTQPQGHSTSGSHERYKSKEQLEWAEEFDCLRKMREWLIASGIAPAAELDQIETDARDLVESYRERAWDSYILPIRTDQKEVMALIGELAKESAQAEALLAIRSRLAGIQYPLRRDVMAAIGQALVAVRNEDSPVKGQLIDWKNKEEHYSEDRYNSFLFSQSVEAAMNVEEVKPTYAEDSPEVFGFEVMNACFDALLERDPRVIAFGQDVGRLGDVNQGFRGMQTKYGELRVSDAGIRECTILGQGIGMALRGLRPIAEIQYLDYLLYALQIMSDDLANLQWRTKGGQKAPVIVRTRGHRLEGIWHSGSPMAGIIHLVRGMHVCVPRDMTRAAGFYNTLLASDEPGLIVEVLNGYRLRERLPGNIGELRVPLGVPEILRPGGDVTVVTYGACCRIALATADELAGAGIEAEVIDVQTLLPFDLPGVIGESLRKTGRILFVDEDVPGGTTGYMLQEVIERQGGYYWLDSKPRTLPARAHRPAYGSDGDYYSKPNAEQIVESVFEIMNEADPPAYPIFWRP